MHFSINFLSLFQENSFYTILGDILLQTRYTDSLDSRYSVSVVTWLTNRNTKPIEKAQTGYLRKGNI